MFSEFIATFGLLAVIWGVSRSQNGATPFAVAAYITAAYWFTASTSFANPAVTLARAASDTFAGIRLADVPGFVVAQLLGAMAATLLFNWLQPIEKQTTQNETCCEEIEALQTALATVFQPEQRTRVQRKQENPFNS